MARAAEPVPRRRHGRPGERGFTIVEMLVAMLLMALVGLTLVRFQTFQLAGTGQLATAAMARIEADNRAVEYATMPAAPEAPQAGQSVNGGIVLFWTATPAPPPEGDLFADMVAISIAVALEEGGPPVATRALLRPRQHSRELPR